MAFIATLISSENISYVLSLNTLLHLQSSSHIIYWMFVIEVSFWLLDKSTKEYICGRIIFNSII